MAYEIDFIGVVSDVKKDADAIANRQRDESDEPHTQERQKQICVMS